MIQTAERYGLLLATLVSVMTIPVSSSAEERSDAEVRCNASEFRVVMEEVDRENQKESGIDPAMGLAITREAIELCPEDLSLAGRRFYWMTRLESPSNEQILSEFQRVATAFQLAPRAIVPGAIRRPIQYLIAHRLELDRCLELLEYGLVKLDEMHDQYVWGSASEDRENRMEQGHRIGRADTLVLLSRVNLALGSTEEAKTVAESLYVLAKEIEGGPDLGADKHLSFEAQYWILRGEIAEATENLPDAFEFYRRAESLPGFHRQFKPQAKRIWLLMGGTEKDWKSSEVESTDH